MSFCTKLIEEGSLSTDKEVDFPNPSPIAKKSQLLWLSLESDSHGKEEMNVFQTRTEHKFSNNHALIWERNKKARKCALLWILKLLCLCYSLSFIEGFPVGSEAKESAYNAGDTGLIPGLGRSPGEGNGNPLQYSCLENSMYRESGGLQSMGSQRVRHDWANNTT